MTSYEITLSGDLQANAHPWRVEVDERAGVAARARLVAPRTPSAADARTYRDILTVDPAKRHRGWLVEALELS